MNRFQEELFGGRSFVQFTLDEPLILGKPSLTINDNVVVELWDNGVLYFQPEGGARNHSILLSVGVHGNETAPIEMIDQLVTDILAGEVALRHALLIVIANPKAIKAGQREIDENMNRLFDGTLAVKDGDSPERCRSRLLIQYSRDFFGLEAHQKIHYDLHTAIRGSIYRQFALSPNPVDRLEIGHHCSLLEQWGIEAILTTTQSSATFSAFTAHSLDATSFTLELGSAKPFGSNDMTEFALVIAGLRAAISGDESLTIERKTAKRFYVAAEIVKETDAFRLLFPPDTVNFTPFNVGDVLATDKEFQYIVTKSGERILFPNENVANGQRALVIVHADDNDTENSL